ncbi:MAG: hypothetical protein OXT65_06245 [Alphaproteobacteria bacterium]|nr:hypothetical protein [Alphaproteobacteria bacterium]
MSQPRTFIGYRRTPPNQNHRYNTPDAAQYEGVQFSDGTVVIRWRTSSVSTSVWNCLDDFIAIHGHVGEYNTELHWNDGTVQLLDKTA